MAKSKSNIFSKLLLFISLSVVAIIIIAIALGYIYEDKIKQFSIEQINKNIDAKIKVNTIELSFLSHFPNASLDFKNVTILPKDTNDKTKLVSAEHIYLSFDVFDILHENYLLKNVVLEQAQVNLLINKKGEHNFHILKASTNNSDSSDFFLNLSSVNIANCTFIYHNKATNQDLILLIKNAKAKGDFSSENFNINLVGENVIKQFSNNNRKIIADKSINLDVVFTAEPHSGIYNLSKGNITYQALPLDIVGSLSFEKNTMKINAEIKATNINIKTAINNLPAQSKLQLTKYKPSGLLSLNASINGFIGGSKSPHIKLNSQLKDASFILKDNNISFSNLSVELTYNNGTNNNLQSSFIKINNLKSNTNFGNLNGQLEIRDLWNPQIKMKINSHLILEEVKDLISIDTIETMSGNADLTSWLSLSLNYIDSTENWKIRSINMDHNFNIQNAHFAFKSSEITYDSITANGRIENNNINIKTFKLLTQNTKLKGNISIHNLPITIFQTSTQRIDIEGNIATNKLSYKQLISAFPSSKDSDSRFTNDIYLNLNLQIGSFEYENILASNIEGQLVMNNRKIYSKQMTLNAFDGRIVSSFMVDGSRQGVYHLISDGDIDKVNISKAFAQLNNFGQTTITSNNIKGALISTYSYKSDFDSNWNIIKPSVEMSADIELSKGELVDMTSLNALTEYTKIDDFANIHFSTLKNTIYIKNEKINIPDMEIHSDKMNIKLDGIHGFDNKYEYHFVVLLSEVLGKHYQQKLESEFGEIENDGYGQTRLFFTMKGQGENFEVKYDRKGLGKKLKADLKEEKASLKDALKQEFGLFKTDEEKAKSKSDSLKKTDKQKEKEQLKKQEEGKFILDWGDDDG